MVCSVERMTRWRVHLDTTPQRLGRFLALAVALHVPFSPVLGLVGLLRMMGGETEAPVLPPVTEIPLDLIDDDTPPAKAPGDAPQGAEPTPVAEPEAAQPAEPAEPKPKPKPKPEPKDAGAADAESPEDAGTPDASKSDAGTAQDAGTAGDAGPAHKPGEGIGSPVAGVGDKRVVDPNANVQLMVHNDRVRQHPLGGRVGPLLRNVYQWRDFFGPTAIDPVRDVDRMMLVGPQLRDSRDVVAILQFNIPQERVRGAVDLLVQRDPEGGWVDGPVPVAKAHADRGERAFVLPSPKLLIVTPPSALEAAKKFRKPTLPPPKADEIAIAYLATPWRAFLGLPVVIPKSITSASLRLSPAEDGGVVIDILAHDETEPLAASDARALTNALAAATSLDLGLFGSVLFGSSQKKFIQKGSFEADGADIRGEIVLTRAQTETLLDLASSFLAGRAPRPRPAPSAAVPGATAEPAATPAPAPAPPPATSAP
jgi:outer membrane biosynthesis protein TonB